MSVTIAQTRLGQYSVLITATPSTPGATLYWYIDGNLVETSVRTTRQIELRPSRMVQVEVLDTTAEPEPAFPDYALLTWDAVDDATEYRVDYWDGDSWEAETTISGDGKTYMEWESGVLANGAHQFRIVPLRLDGTEGTPRELDITMVRPPDTPASTNAYTAGTTTLDNVAA